MSCVRRRTGIAFDYETLAMLKIERTSVTHLAESYFLTGKISADHLPEIARLISDAHAAGRTLSFDLEGVGPVDREVVSFFVTGAGRSVRLLHCPTYLREWIRKEKMRCASAKARKTVAALAAAVLLGGAARARAAEPVRLSLREAVQRALSDGTTARIAAERVTASQAGARQAESALLPRIDAEASDSNQVINLKTFGLTFPGTPFLIGPFNVFDAHAQLAVRVIDIAARRRWDAARTGIAVSEAERTTAENDVAAAVATLYVTMQRAESQVEERRATVALFEKLEGIARDQQEAGVATKLDTTRAQVQLTRQRQALLIAQQERDAARLALLHAIGADLGSEVALTDSLQPDSWTAPSLEEALGRARSERPELREIAERRAAAKLATAAEKAERLPMLSAQFQGGYDGNYLGDLSWVRAFGAVVSVPIYTGGMIDARIAEAQARERELGLQAREVERQVEEEIRRSLLAWETARQRVAVARESARLAQDELEFARDRFAHGVAADIEVDNAQTAYTTERDGQIAALADQARAWYDLQRATGGIRSLLPAERVEPAAPSPR